MNMPGFAAEASLGKAAAFTSEAQLTDFGPGIVPQDCQV